jgi:hypothetical protein
MTYGGARRSGWHRLGAAEPTLMRRWTHQLSQPADELMVMLSRAADHSVLWGVLAAGAAMLGGTRGRRRPATASSRSLSRRRP